VNASALKKKRLPVWIKVLCIALIVIAVLAAGVMIWQRYFLVLPKPVVIPPEEEDGPEAPAVTAGLDKFDILLLGLDSREGEPELGDRTDTILLVNIDSENNHASVLSIPRDTRVRYDGKWRKINEVYGIDGCESSVKAVEELLSMHIERYAVVDFQGVIELVDMLGGIDVDVPVRMYKPLENIDLQKGSGQHLNGYDALAYMRYRDERLSDMDRSERQKEVLLQLAGKLQDPSRILKLPSIVDTAMSYIQTNISPQEILALAKYSGAILDNGVENRVLPGVNDLYLGGWYYVPFLEEIGLPIGEAELEYRAYLAEQAKIAKAQQEADEKGAGTGDASAEEPVGEESGDSEESGNGAESGGGEDRLISDAAEIPVTETVSNAPPEVSAEVSMEATAEATNG